MAAAIVTIVSVAGTLSGQVSLPAEASQSGQCPGTWTIEPSPNLQGGSNVLADVAAISPTEAMAVGWLERRPGNLDPLVERWDGTRWSLAPSPDVGGGRVALVAISAVTADDVWVVGYRVIKHNTHKTFAAHWDGSAWTTSATPRLGSASAQFTDVEAIAPDDVWAVGFRLHLGGSEHTLVEHWDGTAWAIVPNPDPDVPPDNRLSTVAAVGPDDVWAVGYWGAYNSDTALSPLYEHWDGARLSVVESEQQSSAHYLLAAVAISSDDVVAVGNDGNFESGEIHKPMVRRWEGVGWFDPDVPRPTSNDSTFSGVAATGSDDVWAVGYQTPFSDHQTLAMHWEGTAWTICTTPNRTSQDNELIGAVAGLGVVWAVGTFVPSGSESTRTLISRWSGG